MKERQGAGSGSQPSMSRISAQQVMALLEKNQICAHLGAAAAAASVLFWVCLPIRWQQAVLLLRQPFGLPPRPRTL